jgi:hypothetical protein
MWRELANRATDQNDACDFTIGSFVQRTRTELCFSLKDNRLSGNGQRLTLYMDFVGKSHVKPVPPLATFMYDSGGSYDKRPSKRPVKRLQNALLDMLTVSN